MTATVEETQASVAALKGVSTDDLMARMAANGAELTTLRAAVDDLMDDQLAVFIELATRETSFRLMSKTAGVSNVAISRIVTRWYDKLRELQMQQHKAQAG